MSTSSDSRSAAVGSPRLSGMGGVLGWVERLGNRLPDQITIFVSLAVLTLVASAIAAASGVKVAHPISGKDITAFSLLSRDGMQWVLSNVVANFTGFAPLGTVLVAMIGIGVAERSGLFAALLKLLVTSVPAALITPAVLFAGVLSHVASDAGYIVLPPLAAALYASLGRHPVAGVAAAFAGVAGGFSANVLIVALDPLLAGITQEAARVVDPRYNVYALANYFFQFASAILLTLVGWFVSVRIVEPRFGRWDPSGAPAAPVAELGALSRDERRGLLAALGAVLCVAAIIIILIVPENGVLRNPAKTGLASYKPAFDSIVGLIVALFILPGLVYGLCTRHVKSDRDVAKMMSQSMSTMGHYIVMAFFAGQFIKWFEKSQLGLILAIEGAEFLRHIHFTGVPLMIAFIFVTMFFEFLMSSASAKWTVMAPIFVPMFMLVGLSPEMTQALYRIGDSVTNIINPVNVYFPIVLAVIHRYVPGAGLGTLLASMLPYTGYFLIVWTLLLVGWALLGVPLGPGAPIFYTASQPVAP